MRAPCRYTSRFHSGSNLHTPSHACNLQMHLLVLLGVCTRKGPHKSGGAPECSRIAVPGACAHAAYKTVTASLRQSQLCKTVALAYARSCVQLVDTSLEPGTPRKSGGAPECSHIAVPGACAHGMYKTVTARFWPRRSSQRTQTLLSCPLFARGREREHP